MNGSTVFSKLDLKWGYHQLELTPKSREITNFAVHSGVYRYKRLIFGVSSASELYQYEISRALAGIEGVDNISDDIIVHGPNQTTHDERLHAVMQRLKAKGLTLNPDKCQLSINRLIFMGILISEKGIGPTKERIRAVIEAKRPENARELRSFIGLANYSARFIPQFATITEPLRRLLHKDVHYEFGPQQEAALRQLKKAMAEASTLAYFDKDAPTRVIADASPVGLGAVLLQRERNQEVPVCYASRSLSDCERRYSQTEKEALSLVWACERFHAYIYGREFDLVTDHKPLEIIYGIRSKPSARIERWVLRLQPYSFKVIHVKGSDNIADPLSRLVPQKPSTEDREEGYVRFVAVNATPSAMTTREIEEASADDAELTEVRRALETGHYDGCKAYAPIASELCTMGKLVLRGTRIVIPQKMRPRILALAHEGHLGVVGTKINLRTKVWWPGIDKATEKYCRTCHGCQLVARPDPPEPLRTTTLPEGPWIDVAADLMGPLPSGHSLLVVVDYYSRYYEVVILQSTTSAKVIEGLEEIFSRHGLPATVKTDNGPQFVSADFRSYMAENGIRHNRTTPRWAQANGEVERQNSSILKRLKIAQAEGQDWRQELRRYLLQYRAIPHNTTGRSPGELLFNRQIRTKMPKFDAETQPIDQTLRDRDSEAKAAAKIYADERRGARYSDVRVGDQVLVQQEKHNKLSTAFNPTPHTVISKDGNSLIVQSPDGGSYSRNTTHVRKYMEAETKAPETMTEHTSDTETKTPETVAEHVPLSTGNKLGDTEVSPPLRRSNRTVVRPKKYEDFT